MELYDYGIWAGASGIVVAVIASVWFRSVWPIVGAILGTVAGGVAGRVAFEALADPATEFGSNLEGFDWILGFTSIGLLVGGIIGAFASASSSPACPG
jgi:hypothetical protein